MNILKILTDKRLKGNIGEEAVCKLLKKKKYKILERNYVANGHEIDIIAKDREHICFVEVKTRSSDAKNAYGTRPCDAVDAEKRRSVISAASVYSAMHRGDGLKFRFDVAEVYLNPDKSVRDINYLECAFVADGDRKIKFKR